MILIMILCLCLASSYRVNGTRIISKEEDLELERQLKLINKPPIKSIQVLKLKLYIPFRHPFRFSHWNGIFRYRSIPAFRFGYIYIYIYI